jgi:hypothetical protein
MGLLGLLFLPAIDCDFHTLLGIFVAGNAARLFAFIAYQLPLGEWTFSSRNQLISAAKMSASAFDRMNFGLTSHFALL